MIAIGSDHGGFALKKAIIEYFEEKGIEYRDFGTYSEESCDYPVYSEAVARAVASGEAEKGVVVCGTGIGASIAANKVKGIRCALCGTAIRRRYPPSQRRQHAGPGRPGAGYRPCPENCGDFPQHPL